MIDNIIKIKEDLNILTEQDFVAKYLLNIDVWYFTTYLEMDYPQFVENLELFNNIVSQNLDISCKNILIVGSGKLGFSLSPKKPLKKFDSDANKESDLDIAIISNKYFNYYWERAQKERSMKYITFYPEMASSIFRGFIDNHILTDISDIRKDWRRKEDYIIRTLKEKLPIKHKINFRIYKSWEDLQMYHTSGLKVLKKQIIKEGI